MHVQKVVTVVILRNRSRQLSDFLLNVSQRPCVISVSFESYSHSTVDTLVHAHMHTQQKPAAVTETQARGQGGAAAPHPAPSSPLPGGGRPEQCRDGEQNRVCGVWAPAVPPSELLQKGNESEKKNSTEIKTYFSASLGQPQNYLILCDYLKITFECFRKCKANLILKMRYSATENSLWTLKASLRSACAEEEVRRTESTPGPRPAGAALIPAPPPLAANDAECGQVFIPDEPTVAYKSLRGPLINNMYQVRADCGPGTGPGEERWKET